MGIVSVFAAVLAAMLAVTQLGNIFVKFCDLIGFETKWTIKKKEESSMLLKHEEKLTSIMNDIRDIKESGKTDNKVTRDKFKERAEATGEMVLSQCEYEQFWTAFHEYESEPLNGDGLIHSVVEVYMRGFTSED